jgi:hypothetical protein
MTRVIRISDPFIVPLFSTEGMVLEKNGGNRAKSHRFAAGVAALCRVGLTERYHEEHS